MGTIKKLNKWANTHTYYPLDLVRMALGGFLFYKGVEFMNNQGRMLELMQPFDGMALEMVILHYIAPAHFLGGILIALGLLTRWVTIAQLPILIGAVLTNFLGTMDITNLILSLVTLLLCIFFSIYGSGKHSADYFLKMQQ